MFRLARYSIFSHFVDFSISFQLWSLSEFASPKDCSGWLAGQSFHPNRQKVAQTRTVTFERANEILEVLKWKSAKCTKSKDMKISKVKY
jgi:hypothetical protein